ncbi:MAG: preprotein translocase subunit SecA [Phycisphaeraceae bacterium]|nr:preprotein translocase subunit SecA [Phycisphaeraceae bacterium]MCW5753130.1 preprotein translocase subunit SecA [Phycisphaeraceae bacterium]
MAEAGIPIIGPLMNKLIGSRNERFVKRYWTRVEAINALEPKIRQMSDEQLRSMLGVLRAQRDAGAGVDDLLVESFAVAREAMDRAIGIRSIFNPAVASRFEADKLPGNLKKLYIETKERLDGLGTRPPTDALLGCTQPVPAYVWGEIPHELYEAVREIYPESRPPFRSRPFDVQLIGGMVLASGKIAEMKTGEGKTIVAPLACFLACVMREQVHVVTVNDYLVQRDRDWTFPFFHALGMTVGAIHPMHMQPEDVKRQMYRCDVVYGTTSEFGFDYLRDNMKRNIEQQVQRRRQFAVVDEVDSILIDEARTPLIISGLAHEDKPRYEMADKLARHLVARQKPWDESEAKVRACKERIKGLEGDIRQVKDKGRVPEMQEQLAEAKRELPELERERDKYVQYFEVHPERKQCHLTHEGIAEAQRTAGMGSFYVDQNMDLPHLLEQSVRAHAVYERDRDYVVMEVPDPSFGRPVPSIVIVDVNTGRPMIGRQWSDGLHQAIEAKEGVPIKEETQTVATITIQNFFKMYKRLAGMTGTADTEAQEFHDIYGLDVVSIPTNKPVRRGDFPDMVYLRARDKWESIVDEIKAMHDVGRPILVGTTSVAKSEMLSQMLTRKHGIKHEVLNAKQHDRESVIIESAGQLGAVMIATNMAGRGTDIKLGAFTREQLLDHWLRRGIASRKLTVESSVDDLRRDVYAKIAAAELGVNKREIEGLSAEEIELRMLRHWAFKYTLLSERKMNEMSTDDLRSALSATGKLLLHEVRWFENIEDLGGLHVIGTERHEARRIDNQLRGRSGRQGDRGSSRFYVSLEDDLMKMFGGETLMKVLPRLGLKEGDAIESRMLSKRIEGAQRKVEERNFQIRKQILEYDEVMEHQRQTFYGLRQRVLEGRDVRGLVMEFLQDAVESAADQYLDPGYAGECVAEAVKETMECSIVPDKLRGRDREEMEVFIRREAKAEAKHNIVLTVGEYMPMEGSEVSVDFDSAGLINWAKSHYGIDISAADLREGGEAERRHVIDLLYSAAEKKIDEADLGGIAEYLDPMYGPQALANWVKERFETTITPQEIVDAQASDETTPAQLIMDRVRELYRKREVEYPVEFAMEMTMALMRQDPKFAAEQLCQWANRRFELKWEPDRLKTTPPAKVKSDLQEAAKRFFEEDHLQKEVAAALACKTDDELDQYFTRRFGVGLPDRMRWLTGEERLDAIKARVENLLRADLLELERSVLLETLDTNWKDHLYAMDQTRDSISFRAFSQQDPRIAFKKEGARLFSDMLRRVRERVSELIFRARISPQAILQAQAQAMMASRQRAAPAGAAPARAGSGGSSADML